MDVYERVFAVNWMMSY